LHPIKLIISAISIAFINTIGGKKGACRALFAVAGMIPRSNQSHTEKDEPHPQVVVALGLRMTN
jgi:hypothetical protein